MRTLIIGAGVLGSVFAARLHDAGQDVTLLARGERLKQLQRDGVVLVNAETEERTVSQVPVVGSLPQDESYDLALVIVRYSQLDSVLDMLQSAPNIPTVLFLGNNPDGPDKLTAALGESRVMMGFAGAAGKRIEGEVHYIYGGSDAPWLIFGEPDGSLTERTDAIQAMFEDVGFHVDLRTDIDAWLKYHVALVIPLGLGIYAADGDNYRLARTPDALMMVVRAIREGFHALRAAGYPITPGRLRMFTCAPEPLLVWMARRRLATEQGRMALAEHANAARDEMGAVLISLLSLVESSNVSAPNLYALTAYRDPAATPMPEGRHDLHMNWLGLTWAGVAGVFAAGVGALLIRRRHAHA